jgi:catechol 2,3-dioxygenase-like lactoylglutathione lyase family enzyme
MFTFEHVHLSCADVAAMERFLIDALDGRLIVRRVTHDQLNVEIEVGGGRVFLQPSAAIDARQESRCHPARTLHHIGFRVDDMRAALERLEAHGAALLEGPFDWREDLAFAYVAGPEGLVIELLDRRPRRERLAS